MLQGGKPSGGAANGGASEGDLNLKGAATIKGGDRVLFFTAEALRGGEGATRSTVP